jgi:nitric oxide reductase subunit B
VATCAPDWSADWLHREATGLLELWARRDFGKAFAELDHAQQGGLKARLQDEMRANTYDKASGVVTVSETVRLSSSRWPSITRVSSAPTPN